MRSHIRILLVASAAALAVADAAAEDVTTLSGRVLREVTFGAADVDTVRVKHRDGDDRVYFYDLPAAIQSRLGFDPVAALKRKTQEVERLRAELAEARGDAVKATQAAETARVVAAQVTAPRKPELWQNLPPTPAPTTLPPLKDGELVTVYDLVNHVRSEPAAAEARYRKKSFRLEGVIERMEEEAFSRSVKLVLESPDRSIRVVCTIAPPDAFKSTYTKAEGTVMMATDSRGTFTWLRAGERVVVNAHFGGLKEGALHLTRCELVR